MNDDPAFDDADQENKENAVELGKKKIFYSIPIHNSFFFIQQVKVQLMKQPMSNGHDQIFHQ